MAKMMSQGGPPPTGDTAPAIIARANIGGVARALQVSGEWRLGTPARVQAKVNGGLAVSVEAATFEEAELIALRELLGHAKSLYDWARRSVAECVNGHAAAVVPPEDATDVVPF